jgi:hypothetical protein
MDGRRSCEVRKNEGASQAVQGQPTRPARGHQTICTKLYAKPIGDQILTFLKRSFEKEHPPDGETWSSLFQNPVAKLHSTASGLWNA